MALKETVVSESGEKMPIFDITCFRDSVRYDLGYTVNYGCEISYMLLIGTSFNDLEGH